MWIWFLPASPLFHVRVCTFDFKRFSAVYDIECTWNHTTNVGFQEGYVCMHHNVVLLQDFCIYLFFHCNDYGFGLFFYLTVGFLETLDEWLDDKIILLFVRKVEYEKLMNSYNNKVSISHAFSFPYFVLWLYCLCA